MRSRDGSRRGCRTSRRETEPAPSPPRRGDELPPNSHSRLARMLLTHSRPQAICPAPFGFFPPCGAVAQLGERLNGIQEVEGSTPFGSTLPLRRLTAGRHVAPKPVAPSSLDDMSHK